ncbi:MAG TPA: hypothetical protein PKC30_15340 [Saprospiraceae bacterium]|nr:hypothetical protein [Saprospiraceae bacterium]
MKATYTSILSGLFLLIHFTVEAQFCDCPSDTIFINLNGDVLNSSPIPPIPTKVNEIGCDEGQVDLFSLVCNILRNEENRNLNQSVCFVDGNITFSGDGVNGYCFDPVEAGVGIHDICVCSTIEDCLVNPRNSNTRNLPECEGDNCCQFQIQVVDFSFEITDPCSCSDPLNIHPQGQLIMFFHDVFRFETGGMGPEILSITTSGTHPNFLDMNGGLIPEGTALVYNGVDAWELDFWRPPGTSFGMGLIIELDMDDGMGGNQILLAIYMSDECVAAEDCPFAPIPTLGFWTLIILGMMMSIFSLIYIRKLRMLKV